MASNQKDPRLQAVEAEKQAALDTTDQVFGELTQQTQEGYDSLIAGAEKYKQQQTQALNEELQLTQGDLQQQMDQAEQDYEKEQSAAYTDYQKQVNPYGVESEKLAANGMTGTGYSESAKVSMFNTYQSRVSAARESYEQAVREYDAAMQEAWQLNSAALAKIAYDALKAQTELSLKAVNQTGQLKLDWEDRRQEQQEQFRDMELEIGEQIRSEQLQSNAALLAQREQENQAWQQQYKALMEEYAQLQKGYDERIRQMQDALTRRQTGQIPGFHTIG